MVAAAVEAADLGQREVGRSRVRRIATCRARSGVAARLAPTSSAREMPKAAATRCWISSTVGRLAALRPVGDQLGDQLGAERLGGQRGVGDHLGQGAVQAAHVGVDPPGELGERVAVGGLEPGLAGESPQDGEPGGEVGRVDRDGQAPLEAVAQPRGEGRELARQPVGGEDELAAALIEGVEGVEELLLGVLLALEELDVVDEQDVEVAVAALEALGAARAQGARRTRW